MATLIIDKAVIEDVAQVLGKSPDQLRAWFKSNTPVISAIRSYVSINRVVSTESIENNAVAGQVLDATLVTEVLAVLETGGLIERMEIT